MINKYPKDFYPKLRSFFDLYESKKDKNFDLVSEVLDLEQEIRKGIELNQSEVGYSTQKSFLESFILWKYFFPSVGNLDQELTTINLRTFPLFNVHRPDEKVYSQKIEELKKRINWHSEDKERFAGEEKKIKKILESRVTITNILKEYVKKFKDKDEGLFELFSILFPGHPMKRGEIGSVFTDTSIFFTLIPKKEMLSSESYKQRNSDEQNRVIDYYKYITSFNFEYFQHFPTFGAFDVREVDPSFIKDLCEQSGISMHDMQELLNSQCMMHEEDAIEKYMIHDTWGHIWQADLAQGKYFYDLMANMRKPFSPSEMIEIDRNVISFTDLFFINSVGELSFDECLAKEFIGISNHSKAVLSFHAILSETTAEIIEYFFVHDYGEKVELETSSIFSEQPAKFDFGWHDVKYFCNALTVGWEESEVDDLNFYQSFVDQTKVLLKYKYRVTFKQIKDHEEFDDQLDEYVRNFFKIYKESQVKEYKLDVDEIKFENESFVLDTLIQTLKIKTALNEFFGKIFNEEKHLVSYRSFILLFLYRAFEENPEKIFFQLDRIILSDLPELLSWIEN